MTPARALSIALDGAPTVAQALRCLRGDERPFALAGAWCGAGAVLGAQPLHVGAGDPFALLDRLPKLDGPVPAGFVGGGWVGYLGFGLGDGHPPSPPRPAALPDAALAFYDHVLRRDAAGRWLFEALVSDEREDALRARHAELATRLAAAPEAQPVSIFDWAWTPSPAGHARAVAACVERIRAGDLYQANLTLRLEGDLHGDALDLFAALNAALPTDRAAFVSGPWGALVSLSPELFLARHGRAVRSAPIKGTRPRPAGDAAAAARERDALAASAKDRAENVMIVDLVRNDLGRVCEPGSVAVDVLGDVRAHAGVWHMVSEVRGTLRGGVTDAELVRAAFPPGSVTGAPKVAAMAVIAELESTGREAYTGAIGIASPAAGLELSVAIRTLEVSGGRVWMGVGGGIVADSDPVGEGVEALGKAQPIFAALGAQLPPADGPAPGPLAVARLGPRPLARPDPDLGVFETLLIEDGEVGHLAAHVARLARSARALYATALPATTSVAARQAAATWEGRGVMRLLVMPDGEVTMTIDALGVLAAPPALAPVVLPGGAGAHKWHDRTLFAALEAAHAPALPLLVDLDGVLLETTRANLFLEIDGHLLTPPLDGRILPGVTRAHVLRTRAVTERRLTLGHLAAADALHIASALRGLQRVPTTTNVPRDAP